MTGKPDFFQDPGFFAPGKMELISLYSGGKGEYIPIPADCFR